MLKVITLNNDSQLIKQALKNNSKAQKIIFTECGHFNPKKRMSEP